MFERRIYSTDTSPHDCLSLASHTSSKRLIDFLITPSDQQDFIAFKIPVHERIESKAHTFFLLPSLSILTEKDYSYRVILEGSKTSDNMMLYALDHVGTQDITNTEIMNFFASDQTHLEEEARIDYFGDLKHCDDLYLFIKNITPHDLETCASLMAITLFSQCDRGYASTSDLPPIHITVPSISQIEQRKEIANRICSSMSTAMILQSYGIDLDPLALAALEYSDKQSDYGIWPRNIWAASKYGALGMVTALNSYKELSSLLSCDIPVVATLTYKKGELTNAAVPETKGHLMVIKGIHDKGVLVNDPAGKTKADVERYYDKDEFARAWLHNKHGICYVFKK